MAKYLRDERLKNLSLSESSLKDINDKFVEIIQTLNAPGMTIENNPEFAFIVYTIRFDNKGFKVYSYDEFIKHFKSAKSVERVILQINTFGYWKSNSFTGKGIDIRFDSCNANNCLIQVDADDDGWVDSQFLKLNEVIKKHCNLNFIIRNSLVVFSIQTLGVVVGFLLSLLAAKYISPKVNIEYAYGFTFVIAFLIFSNIWTFLYSILLNLLDHFWPNITFKQSNGVVKVIKTVISGCLISGVLGSAWWVVSLLISFAKSLFI